jgi:hypothetical protein
MSSFDLAQTTASRATKTTRSTAGRVIGIEITRRQKTLAPGALDNLPAGA